MLQAELHLYELHVSGITSKKTMLLYYATFLLPGAQWSFVSGAQVRARKEGGVVLQETEERATPLTSADGAESYIFST